MTSLTSISPHIPTLLEIESLSASDLHKLWKANDASLIGLLFKENIPHFALHGTSQKGVLGLQKDKKSINHLCLASYTNQFELNQIPIHFLATLYKVAKKAHCYTGEQGGIFVLQTEDKKYKCFEEKVYLDSTPLDSDLDDQFLERVRYQQNNNDPHSFAWETHLKLNPEEFDSKVKGVITESDLTFKDSLIEQKYHQWCGPQCKQDDPIKFHIIQRIALQEILFKTFDILKVTDSETNWSTYQQLGEQQLLQVENISNLSQDKLSKVTKNRSFNLI